MVLLTSDVQKIALVAITACAGQLSVQAVRSMVGYSSRLSSTWRRTLSHWRFSSSSSQRSTLPLFAVDSGSTGELRSTRSPSPEIICVIFKSFSNLTWFRPSKALPRWGCTARGSLVCDRISSICSSARKKKRGKKRRFISR